MTKVHILGGPGSGKTTLAQSIASQLDIPHYDLDQLGLKYGPQAEPYVAETMTIVQQSGWVTEGIYLLFVDLLLHQADFIILLDIPWATAARRIVQRHIISIVSGTNQYPGIKALVALLRYARGYYLNLRPDSEEAIRAYFAEHRVWTPPTTESVLMKLERYPTLVIPLSAAFVHQYLAPYQEKVVTIKTKADQHQVLARLRPSF